MDYKKYIKLKIVELQNEKHEAQQRGDVIDDMAADRAIRALNDVLYGRD